MVGYEQYMAYKMIVENILLNKSKTGIVNIIFKINKAKSIDSFYFNLPLGIIKFHIIKIKISFLLSFKDIN